MQLGDRDASLRRESKSHCCASFFQIFKDFDELLKFCLHFCPRYLELKSGRSSQKDFLQKNQPSIILINIENVEDIENIELEARPTREGKRDPEEKY